MPQIGLSLQPHVMLIETPKTGQNYTNENSGLPEAPVKNFISMYLVWFWLFDTKSKEQS